MRKKPLKVIGHQVCVCFQFSHALLCGVGKINTVLYIVLHLLWLMLHVYRDIQTVVQLFSQFYSLCYIRTCNGEAICVYMPHSSCQYYMCRCLYRKYLACE